MPRHIKRAALAGQQEEADARVRGTVEAIIADVAERGDTAVRELSERFDKSSPPKSPGLATLPRARRRTRAARIPRRLPRCIWAAPTRSMCWAASRRWRRWR